MCQGVGETSLAPIPRFSLVIPAYNEAVLLPRLLATVATARSAFQGGESAIEVIVADNGSTDRTADLALASGCRVVPVAKRVIAAARNGGAHAATGEILCFVDADSQIHPETFNAIDIAVDTGRYVAGATGVRMERWSAGIGFTFLMLMPVVLLTGMDTGVVFCRRADFFAVGGYDERRLLGEDVAFLWVLKRLGSTRGQRLARLTQVKATTSTRKFDKYGDWHWFTQVIPAGAKALFRRTALTDLANRYWYRDR